MDLQNLLSQLTLQEKAALVSGTDFMFTNPIPRLKIPPLRMSDGPHGLRVQNDGADNGVTASEIATAFPTAATAANGWNSAHFYRMGRAIARECLHYGVQLLLGPAMNVKRNPRCGRNFEYVSEDPYLAGTLAAAQVNGIQSEGVGACVKHFALNNAENYRFSENCIADMRAAREIYLKVFERIVKESHPYAVMSAYNQINGTYCSQNEWLLNDVLRKEWGFDGAVITDWGAIHERVSALKAGLDLEMPGDTAICRKSILDAVQNGTLSENVLDAAVFHILKLLEKCTGKPKREADFKAHHKLSGEIARDCAVLLKNDGILPLSKDDTVFVAGELFQKMRYQGAGSSMITPAYLTTPENAFQEAGIAYEYARGYEYDNALPHSDLVAQAVEQARNFNKIIVFAGLTDFAESEGADRPHMRLPESQLSLVDALIQTGKRVIVVLFGGSPVELPFLSEVHAVLNMYLPGQNGGEAAFDLLFGNACPNGRLAETWVKRYADIPFSEEYSKEPREVYKESIFVGYRYYETAQKEVLFPFGFGLSYTAFAWRNMQVTEDEENITVTCEVENVGSYSGADVVQLYAAAPRDGVFKPTRELRAFAKVYLNAGELQSVTLSFCKNDLSYWDVKENRFVTQAGVYELQLCSDSATVRLSASVNVAGESFSSPYSPQVQAVYGRADLLSVTDALFEEMSGIRIPPLPPKKPITLESRFSDIRGSVSGRFLYYLVMKIPKMQLRKALRMPEGAARDNAVKGATFMKNILETSTLCSMTMAAGKYMPYNFAEAFMHFGNGKFWKGLLCFCKKIKVPKLPKRQKIKP